MNLRRRYLAGCTFFALLAMAIPSTATAYDMKDAIEQTVKNSPEIGVKWYGFRATLGDKDVARAGFFPTIDLSYNTGRESQRTPLSGGGVTDKSFNRHGYTATLNQNLFQGFITVNQVKQLDYTSRARYFEYLAAAEQQSLEASRAFIDVVRYSKLVEIAQDNYALHKGIYQQILQRVTQGVGRRVDLEQINGRLGLAESNLINEISNLHDVSARYARIIGEAPAAELKMPVLDMSLLPSSKELMALADKSNPTLQAARSFYRAAEHDINVRRGAFSPTLDLRATKNVTSNKDGISGRNSQEAVELVLNMNLLRGGADRARLASATERLGESEALGIKACRDMRQQVDIAFNDVTKITSQMESLRQHQLSTEKARDAYRSQFDIGQRTLLDLLDSENELFDARRALLNAEMNQQLAIYRVLGESGRLLETMKVKPQDNSLTSVDDLTAPACTTDYTPPPVFDKDKIAASSFSSDKTIVAKTTPAPISRDVSVNVQVLFDLASANIRPESTATLDQLAATMQLPEVAGKTFVVEGHTDSTGSASQNMLLSQNRAAAVRDYLVKKGVPADRMSSVGYGSTKPQPNMAANNPAQRRVVVTFKDANAPAPLVPKARKSTKAPKTTVKKTTP